MTERRCRALISVYDLNGSGALETEEFVTWMMLEHVRVSDRAARAPSKVLHLVAQPQAGTCTLDSITSGVAAAGAYPSAAGTQRFFPVIPSLSFLVCRNPRVRKAG